LQASQQWTQLLKQQKALKDQEQKQKWEDMKVRLTWLAIWLGSGWSGWTFYILSMMVAAMTGGMILINVPSSVSCPALLSWCYFLRLDKSTIVLPEQREEILQKYLEQHLKSPNRKEKSPTKRR